MAHVFRRLFFLGDLRRQRLDCVLIRFLKIVLFFAVLLLLIEILVQFSNDLLQMFELFLAFDSLVDR